MSTSGRWSRRRFMVTVVTSGLGYGLVLSRTDGVPGSRPLAVEVSRLMTVEDDARVVGRAYLRLRPEEGDVDRLVERIFPFLGKRGGPTEASEVVRRVVDAIRRDFEEERVVRIEGWILARTEARLAALVVLGS